MRSVTTPKVTKLQWLTKGGGGSYILNSKEQKKKVAGQIFKDQK